MIRFFVQEGLDKWLIMDRDTGRTVERRLTKVAADERADELNRRTVLTLAVKTIYSEKDETRDQSRRQSHHAY